MYCTPRGAENGVIVAFDAGTGEKIWTLTGQPPTYSSPVLMEIGGEEVIVVQTETDVLGISMDGDLLWKITSPAERRFYNASTPIIDGQNIIIAGQGTGTKSFKIIKTGNEYSYSENWNNPDLGVSFNTPVLKEGYLYGHEARLGRIYCMSASTGETCWADSTGRNRFASILNTGNEMVSLDANATLLIFEPDKEKFTEKAAYKVSDTDIYAHPLLAENNIYTKDKETLSYWAAKRK